MGLCSSSDFEKILKSRFYDNKPASHIDIRFNHNHVFLKKYSDDSGNVKYRLIYMPSVRASGYEYGDNISDRMVRNVFIKAVTRGYDAENPFLTEDDINYYVHNDKFESSLLRAKSKIFDLAFCNSWEFFFTGTLSADKVKDRSDLPRLHKKFTQFIKDFNKYHNLHIQFLIVPELHSDGVNWHFHGFLKGFDGIPDYFRKLRLSDFLPYRVKCEIVKGYDVFSWKQYENSFGWNFIEPVKNHESIAKYCTKYITKEILSNVSEVGAHLYYRSRGLREPELLKDGQVTNTFVNSIMWDSENEFCKVYEVMPDEVENIMQYIEHTKKE